MRDARARAGGAGDVELTDVSASARASREDVVDDEESGVTSGVAGMNEDGYFGDADGAWLSDDRVPLVLRAREAELAEDAAIVGDVRRLVESAGWYIAASVFCVGMLLFAAEWWGRREATAHRPNDAWNG